MKKSFENKEQKKARYKDLQQKNSLTDEEKAEAKAIQQWFEEHNSNQTVGFLFMIGLVVWAGQAFVGCVYDRTNPEAIIKREAQEREKDAQRETDRQKRYNDQRDAENQKSLEELRRELEYRRSKGY
jgi:hypothetical protein